MKLVELVETMGSIDESLIIFQENKTDFNSDIVLAAAENDDNGIKVRNGEKYYYLIEVFLAKEFIEDWIGSLGYSPSKSEIAKRLFEYAKNDA